MSASLTFWTALVLFFVLYTTSTLGHSNARPFYGNRRISRVHVTDGYVEKNAICTSRRPARAARTISMSSSQLGENALHARFTVYPHVTLHDYRHCAVIVRCPPSPVHMPNERQKEHDGNEKRFF